MINLSVLDVEWLKLLKHTNEEMQLLTEEVMEKVIEEMEQGWNVLTQPIRKLQQRKEAAMFPDEVPCEICGECDTSNCNVIVLCDDCDLAVHQECYGVPHIPEGPWLCRACTEKKSIGSFKPKCMLCPWSGGALRKTTDHRWVHSLCAHLVPETSITFAPSDPYDLVDVCTIQSDRAKLRCVLCRGDPKSESFGNGYPIQCSSKSCHVAFHPMCARSAGWKVDYSNQKSYCCRHAMETNERGDGPVVESEEPKIKLRLNLGSNGNLSPTKSKFPNVEIGENCPLHVTRGGEKLRIPTFAPKVLISQIAKNEKVFCSSDIPEAIRYKIVQKISKYWVLKRESRRGTPLLKSLQLEPSWSQTDAMSESAFEQEWNDKMSLVKSLTDLRLKLSLLRQREIEKLKSLESSIEIFEILSSPFSKILEKFVNKLQREVDRPGYFAYPVPCDLFPDYPMIVQYPMDFSTILKNLAADLSGDRKREELFYPSLLHFYADLKLIWENSRLYNTKTSVFYQAADRLEIVSKSLLPEIWLKFKNFGIEGPFDILKLDIEDANLSDSVIDFDEVELPECTPVRFPKASVTLINDINENSMLSGNNTTFSSLKRRGRPPKKRDGTSGSIDSIASSEDGQLKEEEKQEKQATKLSLHEKITRKHGRPKKLKTESKQKEDDDEGGFDFSAYENDETVAEDIAEGTDSAVEEGEIVETQGSELGNLFWVRMKNGNWCPCELFSPTEPLPRRPIRGKSEDLITVRLFDAYKSVLSVVKSDLKPLSEDFEADLESLQMERMVSIKLLSSAHRSALSTIKK